MREKLMDIVCESIATDRCVAYCSHPHCGLVHTVVQKLIANGVTVREESGCEYCLEDRDGYRRGFGAFSLHNPFHASVWEISTGHCKPRQIYFCPMCGRKLAEPPSGERRTDA